MLLNTRLAVWFGSSVVLCEVLLFSFGDHFIILLRQMATLKKLVLEEPDEREGWQQRLMARLLRGEISKGGIFPQYNTTFCTQPVYNPPPPATLTVILWRCKLIPSGNSINFISLFLPSFAEIWKEVHVVTELFLCLGRSLMKNIEANKMSTRRN